MMNGYNNGIRFKYFNGYYYTCNGFGHKADVCRSRFGGSKLVQNVVMCHKCDNPRHIATFCRRINVNVDPIKNNDLLKKFDHIEMKKEENEVKNWSMPTYGVDFSFKAK